MLQQLVEPIHPKQKKQVVEAIRASGLKVTPSEVAESANLPVFVVAQELNRIATETGAHLEVTQSGNVSYVFSPQFEQAYALAGPKTFVRKCIRGLANLSLIAFRAAVFAGIYLLRISFGILLIASVVALIIVAVAAVLAALSATEGDGGGGGTDGGGLDIGLSGLSDGLSGETFASQWSLNYWCFHWLWDWIYFPRYMWGPSYYPYGFFSTNYDYSYSSNYDNNFTKSGSSINRNSGGSNGVTENKGKPRTKFLDSCFLLLFGENDPNREIENRRWQDVTRVIRVNHGVIVAEQLAPFFQGNQLTEDWMLPILLRLNGMPDVTDSGHIIYLFPAFMNQAVAPGEGFDTNSSSTAKPDQEVDQLRALYAGHLNRQKIIKQDVQNKTTVEPYLQEQQLQLLPERGEYETVYIFVGLAIALSLGNLYFSNTVPLLHSIRPLLLGILSYSSIFIIFPSIRYGLNYFANGSIEERNKRRLEASAQLHNPSKELSRKLDEAYTLALSSMSSGEDKVVYTTEKDLLDQHFEQSESKRINLQNLRSL